MCYVVGLRGARCHTSGEDNKKGNALAVKDIPRYFGRSLYGLHLYFISIAKASDA